MRTNNTLLQYAHAGLALPSDLIDGEWALLDPFFPLPSHVGRLRKWPLRRIVTASNALIKASFLMRLFEAWGLRRLLHGSR